jgi:hypothetical protein
VARSTIARTKTTTAPVHTMIGRATKTIAARADGVAPVFTPGPNCLKDLSVFAEECQAATTETCTYFHVGPMSRPSSCFPSPKINGFTTACPAFYTPVASEVHGPAVAEGPYQAVTMTCCPE